MMKNYWFGPLILGLTACTQQGAQLEDPSAAQAQVAEAAYNELRDGNYDVFLSHLKPELQQYFKDNQKVMKKFSHAIPEGAYKSKTLLVKKMETPAGKPQEFKVSYEIAYPNNLVQYDVSFDRPNGDTQIQNFNIRVFGES